MTLSYAFKVLGLSTTATLQELKQRFRELARSNHPDHGGTSAAFVQLKSAHALVKAHLENQPCLNCEGGKVTVRRGLFATAVTCTACQGTGKTTQS